MISKLARFAWRACIAAALLWAVISIPLPFREADLLVMLRVPAAVLIFIVYVGKTLYDTFFYERQP